MHLNNNREEYEKSEIAFLQALVCTLRTQLEEAGLKGRKLKSATGDLAFAITEILDGERVVPELDGLIPTIAFLSDNSSKLLVSEPTLHERVFGCVDSE